MENKINSGAIFKNDKKGNEKAPDYRGKVNVNGKDMEVALWVKEGKAGKFFSASFQEPYKQHSEPATIEESKSDLPF